VSVNLSGLLAVIGSIVVWAFPLALGGDIPAERRGPSVPENVGVVDFPPIHESLMWFAVDLKKDLGREIVKINQSWGTRAGRQRSYRVTGSDGGFSQQKIRPGAIIIGPRRLGAAWKFLGGDAPCGRVGGGMSIVFRAKCDGDSLFCNHLCFRLPIRVRAVVAPGDVWIDGNVCPQLSTLVLSARNIHLVGHPCVECNEYQSNRSNLVLWRLEIFAMMVIAIAGVVRGIAHPGLPGFLLILVSVGMVWVSLIAIPSPCPQQNIGDDQQTEEGEHYQSVSHILQPHMLPPDRLHSG
jgi:hypothetical protein